MLTWLVQIRLFEWFARKWERRGRETFPDLEFIWRKMDLQEPWEPPTTPIYEA